MFNRSKALLKLPSSSCLPTLSLAPGLGACWWGNLQPELKPWIFLHWSDWMQKLVCWNYYEQNKDWNTNTPCKGCKMVNRVSILLSFALSVSICHIADCSASADCENCSFGHCLHLCLIFEKSSLKNQVWRTVFLVYFKLNFYCLCSLQKSILKLICVG